MFGLRRVHRGEILWMVMLLLVLLAMGMMYISSQQVQLNKVNQWHDVAIRTEYAVDKAMVRFMQSPIQGDTYHELTQWGAEIHIIAQGIPNNQSIIRLNALGSHPLGVILKKQCMISCQETICRRLSCIISEGGH